ncbi:MAG: zinc ribbon domain-containing protein [Pseudanabaenaceae cyanobacterium]
MDRFYPSSQICSNCGHRQKMPLKERVYNCSHCGISINRDLNGSLNLLNYKNTPSSGGIEACGEVIPLESVAFETSMKQEASMSLFDLAV